jgi:rhodanese-related sulfurtransferase
MKKLSKIFLFVSLLWSGLSAIDVNIAEGIPYVDVEHAGRTVRIERIQDKKNKLTNSYAKTSRPCPPFCIHPAKVAKGVETYEELEVIKFMQRDVKDGTGLVIDSRMPQWYRNGTIPGAINIPFTLVKKGAANPYLPKILQLLGAEKVNGKWNFEEAMDLLLFCNGPWCDQSPREIRGLLDAGYPASKLKYYRGGMQVWQLLGLTTVIPE